MCHGWHGLTALALAAPSVASAAPGAIKAIEDRISASLFMDASQANPADNTVTSTPGEKVDLQLPGRWHQLHNVEVQPPRRRSRADCTRDRRRHGPRGCRSRRSPSTPQEPGWAGDCTFTNAGTYDFFCPVHPFMTGTVVVAGGGEHAARRSPPAARRPVDVPRDTSVAFTATGRTRTVTRSRTRGTSGTGTTSTQQNPNHSFDPPAPTPSRSPSPTARAARARRRSASRSRSPTARPR